MFHGNVFYHSKRRLIVRPNAASKDKPNMTPMDFYKWVNKSLLPNSTQDRISLSHKRLHKLGFEVLTAKKGILY